MVANLNNSTVSVLDLLNPALPTVLPAPSGSSQIPVGVQPSALTISPDGRTAYISNLGSNWFTAVDIESRMVTGVVRTDRPDLDDPNRTVSSSTSGIQMTPDGMNLLVTEFRNNAQLLIYDLLDLPLEPRRVRGRNFPVLHVDSKCWAPTICCGQDGLKSFCGTPS